MLIYFLIFLQSLITTPMFTIYILIFGHGINFLFPSVLFEFISGKYEPCFHITLGEEELISSRLRKTW